MVEPARERSSTGRRPKRSDRTPSTGVKNAYSASIAPNSADTSSVPAMERSRLGRIGKISAMPAASSAMVAKITTSGRLMGFGRSRVFRLPVERAQATLHAKTPARRTILSMGGLGGHEWDGASR